MYIDSTRAALLVRCVYFRLQLQAELNEIRSLGEFPSICATLADRCNVFVIGHPFQSV